MYFMCENKIKIRFPSRNNMPVDDFAFNALKVMSLVNSKYSFLKLQVQSTCTLGKAKLARKGFERLGNEDKFMR